MMSISTFQIKRCKLVTTVTVLNTRSFVSTNVYAKPFYMHENQCTQILSLLSPLVCKISLSAYGMTFWLAKIIDNRIE